MAAFPKLLGGSLQSKDGLVSTEDALAGKPAVALYFSAHWCPPCRGFTPQLAEWYSKDLKAKGLEIVFVSSDRDESSFQEYYGEMPWLALPFDQKEAKAALSKKYKVSGIPTVVILDAEANVISKDGRSAIAGDPTGESFPWKPKSLAELMEPMTLLRGDGSTCGADVLKDRVFAFYFSAHWCPPCRSFTPQLAKWYKKDLQAKGLEVVFVSSDKDEASFKEYFKEMPWLALDFGDRTTKEQLSQHFGVDGIPSFVIIDKDGSVITKEGRGAIGADPSGVNFPWHPKPVGTVVQNISIVNETPTVIAFCEGDAFVAAAAEAAMEPLALRLRAEAKAAGEEDPKFAFLVSTENEGAAPQLRSLMGMVPAAAEGKPSKSKCCCLRSLFGGGRQDYAAEAAADNKAMPAPKLMLLDIPDDGCFYEGPEGAVTTEAVEKLLADYEAKALSRKQLQK